MKLSFLVTYYNQKEYVRQSLDSILNIEKPCDWEILVGDDGSDDGTTEVVKEYMEQYPGHIFLYVMDREPGKKYEIVRRSSANRLNLAAHMSGDYFCFLDGDDHYCHTGFVAQAHDIFEKEPGVSIVAFGYRMYSEKAGVLSSHTLPAGHIDTDAYLAQGMYTPAGACVFRNHMYPERKAFLDKIVYFDDNNIISNNLYFGSMYGVGEVIYAYRQTESSTYNAMQFSERAVLNAQSYDVDVLLLPERTEAFRMRYSTSILQTWALGKSLQRLLGKEKWQRYLDGCGQLESSVTAVLLQSAGQSARAKALCRQTIGSIIRKYPKLSCRVFLQCWKRRLSQ